MEIYKSEFYGKNFSEKTGYAFCFTKVFGEKIIDRIGLNINYWKVISLKKRDEIQFKIDLLDSPLVAIFLNGENDREVIQYIKDNSYCIFYVMLKISGVEIPDYVKDTIVCNEEDVKKILI